VAGKKKAQMVKSIHNHKKRMQRDGPEKMRLLTMLRKKIARNSRGGPEGMVHAFRLFSAQSEEGTQASTSAKPQIDLPQFKVALRNVGVVLSDGVVHELFKELDQRRTGTIDYLEFVRGIFGEGSAAKAGRTDDWNKAQAKARTMKREGRQKKFDTYTTDPLALVKDKISEQTNGDPAAALARAFRKVAGKQRKISRDQFKTVLRQVGVYNDVVEQRAFRQVDLDQSGTIDIDEFVAAVFGADKWEKFASGGDLSARHVREKKNQLQEFMDMRGKDQSLSKQGLLDMLRKKIVANCRGGIAGMMHSFKNFRHRDSDAAALVVSPQLINLRQFNVALRNVGVVLSDSVVNQLFKELGQEQGSVGTINYFEFVKAIFGTAAMRSLPDTEDWAANEASKRMKRRQRRMDLSEDRESSLEQIRTQIVNNLIKNGNGGQRAFKKFLQKALGSDNKSINGDSRIDSNQFKTVLRHCGVYSDVNATRLFREMDVMNSGFIDYKDFSQLIFGNTDVLASAEYAAAALRALPGAASPSSRVDSRGSSRRAVSRRSPSRKGRPRTGASRLPRPTSSRTPLDSMGSLSLQLPKIGESVSVSPIRSNATARSNAGFRPSRVKRTARE